MGTTRSFLLLKNRGFTQEGLESYVRARMPQVDAAAEAEAEGMRFRAERFLLNKITEQELSEFLKSIQTLPSHLALLFSENAKWLPYFETDLCDGHICSSKDLIEVSKFYATPVLSFSIFDSDILFVSYWDAEKGTFYDCVKPNYPEMEEYDTEVYQEGLPAFLLSLDGEESVQQLGDIQKLKDIWDEEDMVFADDRMHNLLQFLGMQVIYDENDIPEGFTRIGG